MFTIKVRDADGTTRLYSANKIVVKRDGDRFTDGIYLDPHDEIGLDGKRIYIGGEEVILFSTDASGGKVWVMNAQGATVDQYDL
jgi:hypothetical protein